MWYLMRFLCLLATGLVMPAWALEEDNSSTVVYTLSQAFYDALDRDPRLQAAESRVSQAEEGIEEVKGGRRPKISANGDFGYAYNRNDARSLSIYEGESLRGGVQLSQSLYTFGRFRGLLQEAEAALAEAQYAVEVVRQDVLAEVAQSFAKQLFRQHILEQWEALAALVSELEGSARERVALGTLDQTELYEILRRLHRTRAKRVEAGAQYRVQQATLARLTGATRKNLLMDSLILLQQAMPANLEALLTHLERHSPELAQARQRLKAAKGDLIFQKAELFPNLNLLLNANTGHIDNIETLDINGGVNLEIPLYDGGVKRSRLRNARLAVQTVHRELRAERERIEIEVQANWDLLEGLIMAEQDFEAAIADAQKVVEFTEAKLDAGTVTYVQYIETKQSALEVEIDQLENHLNLEEIRIALLRSLASIEPR